jgi:hypothetical protein
MSSYWRQDSIVVADNRFPWTWITSAHHWDVGEHMSEMKVTRPYRGGRRDHRGVRDDSCGALYSEVRNFWRIF